MEILTSLFPVQSLVVLVPGLLIASLIGFFSGRAGKSGLVRECEKLRQRIARKPSRPAGPQASEMKGALANLARTLPLVVRDLNRDDLSPADVPRQILRLANSIFEPKQILLYGIRNTGKDRVLSLSETQGLTPVPDALKNVPIGMGKIGWAAEHELDMLSEDWATLSRTERLDIPDNHPDLQADIIGPLVQHRKNRQHVLGVLCIGKPQTSLQDSKLMFQMVTNLGSLALVSAHHLKKQRQAAEHDGLTGLNNKRFFLGEEGAPRLLIECETTARAFSIFIFDIDHFKNYNDTNGHPAGDKLLRTMGKMIKASLRPGDLGCRYGGEEFVIAMPDTDPQTAHSLADSLRRKIEQHPFENREKQPSGTVSISGGVAAFPGHGASVTKLIQRADEVLYKSKKGGRNRVAMYQGFEIGDAGIEQYSAVEGLADPSMGTGGPADPSMGTDKPVKR